MAVPARVIWLCVCVRSRPEVMAVRACRGRRGAICDGKAKILLPNEGVAFVYCRICYELDVPNIYVIVLLTW